MKRSDIFKKIIKKQRSTTNYYRVSKLKDKRYKQGFVWRYTYYQDGKQKSISSVSIPKLKEKVLGQGLEWCKL